jgi:hypothetical protein
VRLWTEHTLAKWKYMVVPLDDAKGLKKGSHLEPCALGRPGAEGWEAGTGASWH